MGSGVLPAKADILAGGGLGSRIPRYGRPGSLAR